MAAVTAKALTPRGAAVKEAPSGAFARIVRNTDAATLAWAIPLRGTKTRPPAVRLDLIAPTKGCPKSLLADSWVGSGKRVQLRVTEDNLEQGKGLVGWLCEHAPTKAEKPAAGKGRKRLAQPATVTRKRRVHYRLAGKVRVDDVPEGEVEAFVQSLAEQGAEEIRVGNGATPAARKRPSRAPSSRGRAIVDGALHDAALADAEL
jgi:hypothetical protein